jgi:hypothetical protein
VPVVLLARHSDAVLQISSIEIVRKPGKRPTTLKWGCHDHQSVVHLEQEFESSAMPSDIRSFFGGGGQRPAEATVKTSTVNAIFTSLTALRPQFGKLL